MQASCSEELQEVRPKSMAISFALSTSKVRISSPVMGKIP